MIKNKKLLLFTTALLIQSAFANDINIDQFKNLKSVKELGVKIKEVQTHNDLYVLKGDVATQEGLKDITFTVTKDLKYTFYGTAFDNSINEQIIFKKDMSSYIKQSNFTYGNGKDHFLLFTDPQCPYCKKFEKVLKESNIEDKVTIHYFMIPLSFHNQAVDMIRYILDQPTNDAKLKASYDITVNGSNRYKNPKYNKDQIKKLDTLIDTNQKISQELNIHGTPVLVDQNGQKTDLAQFFMRYVNR